jgi:hypothetical protein
MTVPTAFGRKLPLNDWEGDDATPGAGGAYVTCVDTAVGRDVAWATNGRVLKDGKVYRAAVPGHDPNGISLPQAQVAVATVAHLKLVIPQGWSQTQVAPWLSKGKGLVIIGAYASIPRAYRYQLAADFDHAVFVTHYSPTSGMRLYDPLNPDIHAYGRWVPSAVIWGFLASRNYSVAYVPLQPTSKIVASIVRRLPWRR